MPDPVPRAAPAVATPPTTLDERVIEELVERYMREIARYEKAATAVSDRLRRELRAEARLRHLISSRAKHPDDLGEKLRRKAADARYTEAALRKNLNDVVTDLAGCRVVVYAPEDEVRVVELIDRKLATAARGDARPPPIERSTGYRATHRLVLAGQDDLALFGAICEIQVTTLAAHLFNELEHDITYKEHGQAASRDECLFLADIRRVTELADRQVGHLFAARRDATKQLDLIDTPEALRFVLEQELGRPLAGEFARLYRMLESTILQLSPTAVRQTGPREALERGAARATELGIHGNDVDDVVKLVLGLEEFHAEFKKQARSWRGPRTSLRRALEALPSVDNDDDEAQNGANDG